MCKRILSAWVPVAIVALWLIAASPALARKGARMTGVKGQEPVGGISNPDVLSDSTEVEGKGSRFVHRRVLRTGHPAPATARDTYEYQYDDGTDEGGTAVDIGMTLAWLQRYDAQAGAEILGYVATAVGIGFGTGSQDLLGNTLSVYVWDDPTNDDDPSDIIYLGGGVGVVTDVGDPSDPFAQRIMNVIPLETPITVSGQFYIGASLVQTKPPEHPSEQVLTTTDANQAPNGRSWSAVAFDGNYDPNNPGADTGLINEDGSPVAGVWLLRARVAQSCRDDVDCDDGNPCTTNTCIDGYCGTSGLCSVADFDRDGDVDLADYEVMCSELTGPRP